jgi:hypothetical protein
MEIKPTYNEIANYLRNELGITRDYIEDVVKKSIANTVKQHIEAHGTEGKIDSVVQRAVHAIITDSTSTWNMQSTKDQFAKAVMAEVRKHTGKLLTEQFEVEFTVKAKGGTTAA